MIIKEEICNKFTDEELVALSIADIDYFLCLYTRYEKRLLRYIQQITNIGPEQAEDILQDSFVKIWQNLKGFDQSLKLSSWIYRIVHNETISYWRSKKAYGRDQKGAYHENLSGDPLNALSVAMEIDEKNVKVHEILDVLPIPYKTILLLKYFEEMSYQEISDVLKMPEGTVATQLNRAKKRFLQLVKEKNMTF